MFFYGSWNSITFASSYQWTFVTDTTAVVTIRDSVESNPLKVIKNANGEEIHKDIWVLNAVTWKPTVVKLT